MQSVNGVFEFPKSTQGIPPEDLRYFNTITKSDLITAVELGVQSINQEERLEKNLLTSKIYITNGTISHAQYLETFPNQEARIDDNIARKILKSSLYILNSKCLPDNINIESCRNYFTDISLPESGLKLECLRITQNQRDGHYPFRRLLPANYKDGFYKMFQSPQLPKPREITNLGINGQVKSIRNGNVAEDNKKNLILTQWTQFIEHDLSKSVVTSMIDGTPIECCDREYYKLLPRYIHPSCAPLEGVLANQYERVSCLNYVRSALAVDSACNFGPAEQLNEATGTLDLSQLYGFTKSREIKMRSFKKGLLKVSHSENQPYPLLPLADNPNEFCAVNHNSTDDCFMAGDSRVNNNPFTQILYTLFLRNHNKIAKQLKATNPQLTDEFLYRKAKKINVEIYRYIIYKEWLPIVLGESNAKLINSEPIQNNLISNNYGTSNEFAVAAIRFYLSMLPNSLIQKSSSYEEKYTEENLISESNGKNENIFDLSDNFYKSNFLSYPEKLNIALRAMLEQRAMKMDSNYAETLTKNFLRTTSSAQQISGTDVLAWDIQRGRDHGVQSYINYLEICSNIKVNSWTDLESYIKFEDISKLKMVYKSIKDIDLIVGGISEQPRDGSTVGPTFTCILGEQFSNIRKWQFALENNDDNESYCEKNAGDSCSARKLLCETTQLSSVPKNIFLAPSDTNPLVSCSDL